MSDYKDKVTKDFIKWLCKKAGFGFMSHEYNFYIYCEYNDKKNNDGICFDFDRLTEKVFLDGINLNVFRDLLQRARQGINYQGKYKIGINISCAAVLLCNNNAIKRFDIKVKNYNKLYMITPEENALIDALHFIMGDEGKANDNN